MPRVLVAFVALVALLLPARGSAQPTQKLHSQNVSGSITANGGSVEMLNTGGLGSLRVQSSGTYSGTWEVQCSAAPAGATPVYDTDDEVNLSLEGASSAAVQSVTDAAALYNASIAGCTAVKAIATAWTSGTLTIYLSATTTGGSAGGGGGGAASSVEVAEGGATAQVTATSGGSLQVECTSGCGAGASLADDADFVDGTTAGTPVGGVAESAAPTTVTEGDFGWAAITLNRALKTALFAPDGTSAFGTAGTAATPVLTVQGIASATPVIVGDGAGALNTIIDSGTVTTVSTVTTLSQLGGQAISLNAGNAAAGTLRTVLASDQAQFGGAAAAMADDTANPTVGKIAAYMMCFDGTTWDRCQTTRDPCDGAAKTVIPINIVTATTTELTPSLAGASTHYYVCSINLGPTAGAQNLALVDDDTDNCASVTSGLAGGTTAGTGWNFAANGGLVLGNGSGTVAKTNGTNRVLCAVTSAAVQISGVMTVVAAP